MSIFLQILTSSNGGQYGLGKHRTPGYLWVDLVVCHSCKVNIIAGNCCKVLQGFCCCYYILDAPYLTSILLCGCMRKLYGTPMLASKTYVKSSFFHHVTKNDEKCVTAPQVDLVVSGVRSLRTEAKTAFPTIQAPGGFCCGVPTEVRTASVSVESLCVSGVRYYAMSVTL